MRELNQLLQISMNPVISMKVFNCFCYL